MLVPSSSVIKEFAYDRINLFIFVYVCVCMFWIARIKQEAWSQTIERSLAEATAQYLFMPTKPGQQVINIPLKKFGEPYYIMERGSIEMKMQMLLSSLQCSPNDSLSSKKLEQVRSYLLITELVLN